jgi:Uma2 family endonuclease
MSAIAIPPPRAATPEPDEYFDEEPVQSEPDGLYEVVDGKLVEKQLAFASGKSAVRITTALQNFLDQHPLGDLSSEATFRCFPRKPDQIRRPDISFVSSARLNLIPDEGHVPIQPDLAIEVISPTDTVYALDEKLLDYASAGVPLVWVFNPIARLVRVYKPDGSSRTFGEADILDGGDVLPGFAVVVRNMLPKPAAV